MHEVSPVPPAPGFVDLDRFLELSELELYDWMICVTSAVVFGKDSRGLMDFAS
jgi:hypothetical protein